MYSNNHQETKMPANNRSISFALPWVMSSACPGLHRYRAILALAVAAAVFASPARANYINVYSSLPSSFSISEGQTVTANWTAVPSGSDYLWGWTGWSTTFGGGNYGANFFSGGWTYYAPGTFSISASVSADFYYYSGIFGTTRNDYVTSGMTSSYVTVMNVAPAIQSLSGNLSVNPGDLFNFYAGASDPGTAGGEVLTYSWDLNSDGNYGDYFGQGGSTSFATLGSHPLSVLVSDGNGGNTVAGFTVTVVPEPASLALIGLGAIGLLARRLIKI
jgi:hypothetical protein